MSTAGSDLNGRERRLLDAGIDPYSPKYIYRQIFGTLMKGHHQTWPKIDLAELRALNPETLGWIHMEGSPINYPVVKGHPGDPAYYLVHNFSRELSFHGAVSLDGDNSGMLTDRMTLLGAHHMKDASMFFAVSMLFNPDYYETHRGFDLLLDDGMHHANFFAVHYTNSEDPEPVRKTFESDGDFSAWLEERRRRALYPTTVVPTVRDRVIALETCTCTPDPDDWRDRIVAYAVVEPRSCNLSCARA